MADFDLRRMLDRYLHDYLIKRNMHEPAEILWNEANLEFDPEVPPAIDVPEGFLLEWWNMSYEFEFFRAWLNQHVTPRSEATQEQNASQSGHFLMNSQPSKQLLVNSASTMSTESKSMALHGSGNALQAFSPYSHQEGLLTTTWGNYTPINYANTIGQKSEPLVRTTTETANTAFVEDTDPWIENLVSSFWVFDQDQKELHDNLALGEKISGSTSQALLADDNTSETSDCTSKIPKLSTTADSSTVHQLDTNKDKSVSTSMECV